jgi:hypothetical protein
VQCGPRIDHAAQCSIEPAFRAESEATAAGELHMRSGISRCERLQRDFRRQLGALHREAEAIARHRVDKSSRITRKKQSGSAGRARLNRKWPEHARSGDEPCLSRALAQRANSIDRGSKNAGRVVEAAQ